MPDQDQNETEMWRREALAKLGIAATVAYTAPTVLRLDTSANARTRPSPCAHRRRRCRPDGRDHPWKDKRKKRGGSKSDSDDD